MSRCTFGLVGKSVNGQDKNVYRVTSFKLLEPLIVGCLSTDGRRFFLAEHPERVMLVSDFLFPSHVKVNSLHHFVFAFRH